MSEAWFSVLGRPLSAAEEHEISAYLEGLALPAKLARVTRWEAARDFCNRPAEEWWRAEEAERARLEKRVRLDPADRDWLALNQEMHLAAAAAAARAGCASAALVHVAAGAASQAAYQARLANAAGESAHPFLHKYALYCGGRWPLGVIAGQFGIF